MTMAGRYRGIEAIRAEIDLVRSRRRVVRAAAASAGAVAVVCGGTLLTGAVLGYWPDQPPAALRWALLSAVLGLWAAALAMILVRAVLWKPGRTAIARYIERARPQLRNDLVNAVLLDNDTDQSSPEFVQRAIDEATENLRRTPVDTVVSWRPLRKWSAAACATLVALTVFALLQGPVLRRGLLGAFAPGTYVPHRNTLTLERLTPGDATVFAGSDVTVEATLAQAGDAPAEVLIDGSAPHTMTASDDRSTFACALGPRDQTFRYAVRIGRSRWPQDKPWYTLTVIQRVGVESIALAYRFPPYTQRNVETTQGTTGNIQAPLGTNVSVDVRFADTIPGARMELQFPGGSHVVPMTGDPAGRRYRGDVTVEGPGRWRILLTDADGNVLQYVPAGTPGQGAFFQIESVDDQPPAIQIISPGADTSAAPGAAVPLELAAVDDYGLAAVGIFASQRDGQFREVHRFAGWFGPGRRTLRFALPTAGRPEGDTIEYYASATDTRDLPDLKLTGQKAQTPHFRLRIEDPAKAAAARAGRLEQLRRRLLAILRMQQTQRVNTGVCIEKRTTAEHAVTVAADILAGQTAIHAAVRDTAANFPFDPELLPVRDVLAALASGEAAVAIRQAEVLRESAAGTDRPEACTALAATQDRILDTLHNLLGLLPMLARNADGRDTARPGADLPPDLREKLKALLAALEQFKTDQRKVIDASKNLAKRPVDDFTEADRKLLLDLAAVEDKWEKFLQEAFQDLSKIQEQDFSTAQLLKELASITSDVTMAKDALSKQAVDMATAAEENGYGNAEEIQHNMEKWLSDEPDRQKWDMEDPTDQQNMEMPELPDQLEDMMGDLLEEEEDLFDEIQDTSSKHGGSMDSGWDAMDGPISTPNADGVTGNRLPNSNEMQGRSGEGRTGKSSGEYVEDKAIGKGGRRTPSRLTPDAFQKGQIDDKSSEPPGGATGGGKLSGSGREGLEGPTAPPLQKELGRLAGKQAQLVNRAERLAVQFKANNYAGFKFLQAITLMNRVHDDLQAGRYQNVLRTRTRALQSLRDAKSAMTGQDIHVQTDTAASMPKQVRDNIADAMQSEMPDEYRQALEQYYRQLSR